MTTSWRAEKPLAFCFSDWVLLTESRWDGEKLVLRLLVLLYLRLHLFRDGYHEEEYLGEKCYELLELLQGTETTCI